MQQHHPVHHALLSVSDKASIIKFAQALSTHSVELLSTGGTAHLLAEKGLPVTKVSNYTSFPEMMDGHVKTLHPKVHGGILGHHSQDNAIMEEHQIQPINMVVVNLYPFTQTMAHEGCSLEDAVENINISSPTMVHSTTKNHKDVAIMVKSSNYDTIIKEMDDNKGSLTLATHFNLAIKAFKHTATYNSMIANYFSSMVPAYHSESKEATSHFPHTLNLNFIKKLDMHYSKNSHQQAAFYIEENVKEASIATTTQVQGKALSYNNITNTNAALECMKEFTKPACVIVKHTNPCSMAISNSILDAYNHTYKTNPTSTFSSIIAFNHELDTETTQAIISHQFVKVIIAPSTSKEALKITTTKQNIHVLTCSQWGKHVPGLNFKHMNSSLLVQDHDLGMVSAEELHMVTKHQPSKQELHDALFCWKVAKFVKSNTIIYAKNNMTISIGTGQMSHVYSTKITSIKAANEGLEVKGSSMASDTFFPFHDSIDTTTTAGMTCIIQPGSSIHDDKVIATTNKHSIAMLFTNMRHFHH